MLDRGRRARAEASSGRYAASHAIPVAQVRQRAKTEPGVNVLTQLPGVGEFTALVILAEVGDITRFTPARKLASWAGLTPTVRGSDRTVHHGHISKQGPAWLRWALGQAAQTANRSPGFATTCAAIAARRGTQTATTAIARNLLTRAWHLLTEAGITGPSPAPRLSREGAPCPGRARKAHEPAHPPRTSC